MTDASAPTHSDLIAMRAATIAEISTWLENFSYPHAAELGKLLRTNFEYNMGSQLQLIDETTPRDTDILLWSSIYGYEIAHWYEPWGVWMRKGQDPVDPDREEHYGIGAKAMSHWCHLPTPALEPELAMPQI